MCAYPFSLLRLILRLYFWFIRRFFYPNIHILFPPYQKWLLGKNIRQAIIQRRKKTEHEILAPQAHVEKKIQIRNKIVILPEWMNMWQDSGIIPVILLMLYIWTAVNVSYNHMITLEWWNLEDHHSLQERLGTLGCSTCLAQTPYLPVK